MSVEVELFHDRITHFHVHDQPIRALEVDVRDTALEAAARHETNEPATVALAQSLVAAALLSGHIKGEEKLTLQVIGRGNFGGLMADCAASGDMRAWIRYPTAAVAGRTLAAQVQAGIGDGTMYVIKSTPQRELYRGSSPLSHTDIDGGLQVYLEVSEQIASLSWVIVNLEHGRIQRARGLVLQALGGGDRETFERFRKQVDHDAVAGWLAAGKPVTTVLERLLPDATIRELESLPLRFRCTCSMERVAATLLAVGTAELEDMVKLQNGAEVSCDFCRSVYQIGHELLEQLLELSRKATPGTPMN